MLVYSRKNRKITDPQPHKTILDKVFEDVQQFQATMSEFSAAKAVEQQRIDDFKKLYAKISPHFSPKDQVGSEVIHDITNEGRRIFYYSNFLVF